MGDLTLIIFTWEEEFTYVGNLTLSEGRFITKQYLNENVFTVYKYLIWFSISSNNEQSQDLRYIIFVYFNLIEFYTKCGFSLQI
jgi:hypothetical protein